MVEVTHLKGRNVSFSAVLGLRNILLKGPATDQRAGNWTSWPMFTLGLKKRFGQLDHNRTAETHRHLHLCQKRLQKVQFRFCCFLRHFR